ncbi:MAG: HPr(Ser) kinase/phosphatase [Ruminococcaceae bacterium]|nr:HPr(Ser) kinase/phosphatase [Oscillospiraceae bacterium]MBO5005962.1 HPr(Ser) kinase/phosphatase [Clostridia bacterium]
MEDDSNVIYETPLSAISKEFKLETIYGPEGWEDRKVICSDVSRPGLALSGFFDCFDATRLEILGKAEHEYMETFPLDERIRKYEDLFAKDIPAVIITWGLPVLDGLVDAAKKYGIPVFRTVESTTEIHYALISYLNVELAPRITRHGVLVEVYGEGVLILGDSGIGKSETAIELVKRGHRLVADDAVELKRVSAKTIVGSAPEVLRHFTELRGIGIVDVRRTFGIGAVKETEKINMVLKLEHWDKDKFYDRIGLEMQTTNILGIEIATTTIPVSSGRNLAVIIEVAAMNNKQRRLGYNTAEHFTERLTEFMLNGKGMPLF